MEVNMLTSQPMPVLVQSSCASGVSTNKLVVLITNCTAK